MNKFYITTAIPYVNAKPHIGHALEFVQADTIARFHMIQGNEVLYLCGSDENAIKKSKINVNKIKNIEIIFADAEEIPFKDNYFDVVICTGNTLGNLNEVLYKILLEIKRVLKNKGLFIFSVYNEDSLKDRMVIYKKYWKEIVDKGKGVIVVDGVSSQQFSKQEIINILQKSNFEIINLTRKGVFYLIKAQINKK